MPGPKKKTKKENALGATEGQIKQLFDASPVAMVVTSGAEDRVEAINNKFTELFGYTIEDIPDAAHWWPLAYPDEMYREELKSIWETRIEEARSRKGQLEPVEATVTCKDGSQRHVEIRVSSVGKRRVGMFVDLTERKRMEEALSTSEAELRTLLNAMTDVIFVGNSEGRYLKIVDTSPSLLYKPSRELLGKTLHEVFPKDLADFFLTHLRQALNTQKSVNFEYSLPIGDKKMWFYATASPMTNDKTLMVARDITDLKQAEDALRERERHSQSLLRLSRKLEQAHTYSEVLNAAQDEVRDIIGYQNLWAYLFTPDKKQAKALIAKGPMSDRVMSEGGTGTISIQGDRMMEEFLETTEIMVVEDAQIDERTDKKIAAKMGNRTLVHVPILLFGRHLGSVGMGTFGNEGVRVPTASEREYLTALASHMAVTFDRIHLLEKRQQTEQELIVREREYRNLVENIPDLIVRYDTNLHRIYVNPAWEEASGLSAQDVVNVPYTDIPGVSSPTNDEYLEKLQQALTFGTTQAIEVTWVNAKGITLFLEHVIVPEYDRHGNISGVLSVGHDITARKKAEAQLLASEQLFRALVENSPDFIARYDREFRRIYVNPAIQRLFGTSPENMLGKTPADQSPVYNPQVYMDHLKRVIETGTESVTEMPFRTAQGEMHWSHMRFVPEFGPDGQVESVLHIGRDIHEIKENERRFRMLAENFPDLVMRFDREGRYIYVNPAFEKAVGMPAESISGKTLQELPQRIKTEQNKARLASIRRALDEGIANESEVRWDTETGERIFEDRYVPEKDATGNVVTVLCIARDVTEQKRAEEELQKTNDLLRAIIGAAPTAIIGLDLEGKVQNVWNPAAEKMLGWSAQEVMGKFLPSVPVEKEEEFRRFREWVRTGKALDGVEVQRQRRDGTPIDYSIYASPLYDREGQITGNIAVLVDITERKQAEEERLAHLRFFESMDKVNRAIQGTNDLEQMMHDVLDVVLSIFACDRTYLMYPCDPEAAVWWSPMERTRPQYPGILELGLEIPMDPDVAETLRIMLASDGPVQFGPGTPYPLPRDVSERFGFKSFMGMALYPKMDKPWQFGIHQCSSARIWSAEEERLFQEIGRRISDALTSLLAYRNVQESEERHRRLVELSPDAIGINKQGQIAFVNSAFVSLLGAKEPEELLGKPVLDFIDPDSREVAQKWMADVDIDSRPLPFLEEKLLRVDGSTIEVEIAAVPFQYEGVTQLQIVARDITERKHHELEREAVISVSNALRKAVTRTEILTVLLDQLVDLFKATSAAFILPNPITGGFIVELGRGSVGKRLTGLNIPAGKGISRWVIENKRPYLSNDVDSDPLFYRPELLEDSHCMAAVPLIAKERAIGVLSIARPTSLGEQDLRLFSAIADIAANALYRVTLYEQTEQQLHHLIALHEIDLAISANLDLSITLKVILKNVQEELEVDAASILLMDPITHTLDYAAGIGFRTTGIEQSHVRMEDGCAGQAAREHRTVACPDLNAAGEFFSRSPLLAHEGFVSHYATSLVIKGQVKGVLEVFHRNSFEAEQEWINYFETLATQAAIAIESASLFENLQRSNMELMLAYDATIEGWSRALDLRDRETEGHTQRVTEMVLALAEKMGMRDTEKLDLRRGALLHDIGKMGVPDSILFKAGTLMEDEWEVMHQHPIYAYQMLSPIQYLKGALEIPYCHHEKWDGSGYPRGLKGEEIPLSARMFAIVDVFDALTSDRPYRAAWPREDVYRYIQEQAGKHFDPHVVAIFLETR